MSRITRHTRFAALCVTALLAACSSGDSAADSSRSADSLATTTPTTTPTPAAPALTDANIVAILDNANMVDSAGGALAAAKGTNAEVKTFGRNMMRDHHALRVAGQELATKLGVTPAMPEGDNSLATATAKRDSLNAMPAGAAWDKAYIDNEVAYHEAVLATAQTALGAAQNAELKALIEKAAPNIQAHLEHAKSIQTKLQ